jgi:hypothetical protein
MWNVLRRAVSKSSRVAHLLRVVVAGVGEGISDCWPSASGECVVHVPQKVGIFGASKQTADLSNLYMNGSETCIRPQSTRFSRNTGYRPRLFAMATILPPSTPRGSTARHVRIGQTVSARRGPTEDLRPGSRRH